VNVQRTLERKGQDLLLYGKLHCKRFLTDHCETYSTSSGVQCYLCGVWLLVVCSAVADLERARQGSYEPHFFAHLATNLLS